MKLFSICILILICVYTQASAALNPVLTSSSVTSTDIQKVGDHVGKIQAVPNYPAPSGYEEKGFVGSVLSEIFDPIGKILSDYVIAFQNIINVANTVPVWNASTKMFDESNIYSVGGMIGIGETSPSSQLDVSGNIEASGNISATAYCNSDGTQCFTAPIICNGPNQGLGWDGSNWMCNTMSGSVVSPTYSNCTLDGVTVLHGNTRGFYSSRTSTNCSSIELDRTCDDGTLDGSSSFQYASCSAPTTPTTGEWSTGTWGSCSASCGGGTKYRSVTCASGECDLSKKPSTSLPCNEHSCTPTSTSGPWKISGYGACSASCGGGSRTIQYVCDYDECYGSKPSSEGCNQTACVTCSNIFNYGSCELFVSPIGGDSEVGDSYTTIGNTGSYHTDWGGASKATCKSDGTWQLNASYCVDANTYANPTWSSGPAAGKRVSTSAASDFCKAEGYRVPMKFIPIDKAGENIDTCWENSSSGCGNCQDFSSCNIISSMVCTDTP